MRMSRRMRLVGRIGLTAAVRRHSAASAPTIHITSAAMPGCRSAAETWRRNEERKAGQEERGRSSRARGSHREAEPQPPSSADASTWAEAWLILTPPTCHCSPLAMLTELLPPPIRCCPSSLQLPPFSQPKGELILAPQLPARCRLKWIGVALPGCVGEAACQRTKVELAADGMTRPILPPTRPRSGLLRQCLHF